MTGCKGISLFVDYRLEEIGPFHPTGENIIGSIRAFAAAKYIVSFNVLGDVDFDLQDLFGARGSSADLAVSAKNVSEPALWGGRAGEDGFRPSYWPVLIDAANLRVDQVDWITRNLDNSVLSSLDFNAERIDRLPENASSSLFPRQQYENISEITYLEMFVTAAEDLPNTSTKTVLNAITAEDYDDFRGIISRVCAHKVERWLRLHLLAPQDILVDLPHLVGRSPHILGSDQIDDIDVWNRTSNVTSWEEVVELVDGRFAEALNAALFNDWRIWFGRPVFWWGDLMGDEDIVWPELEEGSEPPDYTFCEDLAKFLDTDDYTPFKISQVSAFADRYVKRLSDTRIYAPSTRFAISVE